jgi:uncharacterized protein YecE (DUF72 family)
MAKPVHIGCSGWNYRDWRGPIYPEKLPAKRWLEHYTELFDTVEINNTFYRLPSEKAVKGWVEQTPRGFRFAVKASRYLTHVKRLQGMREGVRRYFRAIKPLADSPKLGPVLWQLPANFRRDDDRLGAALEQLPKGRHCFEFRHETWFVPEVYDLLSRHRAALVIGDDPERPFQTHEMTASWTYIRLPPREPRAARQLLGARARGVEAAHSGLAQGHRGLRLLQQRLGGVCTAQRAVAGGAARRLRISPGRRPGPAVSGAPARPALPR